MGAGAAMPAPSTFVGAGMQRGRQRTGSLCMSILDAIGNTSLIPLRKVVPSNGAAILVRLESENPTGSMKDRMALSMISGGEKSGKLRPGGTVLEYTGGSTGASLALVAAAKGYRTKIVTSDAASKEKRDQMQALGAELTMVPNDNPGRTSKKLILDLIETAKRMSSEANTFWTDQLNNPDNVAGYFALADEIWKQTNGKVDAFVQSVGTAASLRGTATGLKQHNASVKAIAVEPGESAVLSGGQPSSHNIEGVGIGYTPPLWDASMVDGIEAVTTDEAKAMARRLAREEGIFAGTSSGANVVAALRVAERLGRNATVVTLMVDSGLKYINTDVYRRP